MLGRGSITCAVCLAAVTAVLTGCSLQIGEDDVFRPPSLPVRADLGLRFEDELHRDFNADVTHTRQGFGGIDLALTRVTPTTATARTPLIVSCSGNASDRYSTGTNYAAKLLPFGEALLWDYPGYGDSGGRATVAQVEQVADEFVEWIAGEAADRPLIFWGHSLGGFICADLASRTEATDAVILETTARNIDEIAKAWRPWWAPVRFRPVDGLERFDTADALAEFDGPILVIGAGRDQVLPVELHRSLARALKAPLVSYVESETANHASAGYSEVTTDAVGRLVAQASDYARASGRTADLNP